MLEQFGVTYHTTTLPNNIRLDVYQKPHAPVHLRLSVLCGDAVTSHPQKGIAHFAEHVLVAGTERFPTKDKIALYLDQVGGTFGAVTSHERLWINLRVASAAYIDDLFIALQEMLARSLISDRIVETERGAIVAEYKSTSARTPDKVRLALHERLFAGTPYAIPVLGTLEQIAAVTASDLRSFLLEQLTGGRIGIMVAGDVSLEDAQILCERYLSFIPASPSERASYPSPQLLLEQYDRAAAVTHVPILDDTAHVQIALRALPMYNRYEYAFLVLNNIIGSGRGSLLSKRLRYDTGLVYSVSSGFLYYRDAGAFKIVTDCKPDNLVPVVTSTLQFIREAAATEITEERFELERRRLLILAETSQESAQNWLEFGWQQTATSVHRTYDEYAQALQSLTFADVQAALDELLSNKNIYIAYASKVDVTNQLRELL